MEEPSVLDYLKSKLQFWKRDGIIEIPAGPVLEPAVAASQGKKPPAPVAGQIETKSTHPRPSFNFRNFPWRSLLALVFILLAQRTFEPSPTRIATTGLILYGIGLAWVVLAYLRGEWNLADIPVTGTSTEPGAGSGSKVLRVRIVPLVLTLLLSIAAFLTLGKNLFTLLNVTLWLAALGCFIWAFRSPIGSWIPAWKRLVDFFRRESWVVPVTRWTLLLLAVIGLVVFFRVYNLGEVPSEPFSDHAEKILDVYDVTQGQTSIFFPRNTGREAIQMYLTVAVAWLFGTGLSFLSLKIGTVICGLATLPYMYLLGKELGGKRVALLALLFAGIAYWPNVIARDGLRFPLYPLFVAPTLFYLIRGLRTRSRNDFILSGIALGIGLHGYSPIRILPFVVVIAVGLFLIHAQSKGVRKQAIYWLVILALVSLILFLPLLRYWLEFPDSFAYRAFSRLGSMETPLPAPAWQVFLSNLWNALRMFNWDDGEIWVHSVTHRPALDVVSGALFLAGVALLLVRYIKNRNWVDLFILLSIPLLQMPSILSLAYPGENPALNRAAGSMVPVFVIVALALDGLWTGIRSKLTGRGGAILAWSLSLLLVTWSVIQNYDLVFNQFARQFDGGAWNSSEMGAVIKQFGITYGETDTVWIVPYPHWVDTRLPGVWAGIPNRDFGVWPENLEITLDSHGPKLFIVNVEDADGKQRLEELYPDGIWSRFISDTRLEGKDFLLYFVPPEE
jgi:hypothetical protein